MRGEWGGVDMKQKPRTDREELIARMARGHNLIHSSNKLHPGWRSAIIVGFSARHGRDWDPSIPEALLREGLIRETGRPSSLIVHFGLAEQAP